MTDSMQIDVAIIGAGCVGLCCGAELAEAGYEVAVFERHDAFGRETSSRNSEVIHAGIYYPEGSLKARLCVEGRRLLYELAEVGGIPHRKCGKVIVATSEEEIESLDDLKARGEANGVEGLRMLSGSEVREREPAVSAVAGLLSPETGILDSHRFMALQEARLRDAGGMVVYHASVEALEQGGPGWTVRYVDADGAGAIATRRVINAAGLNASGILRMAGGDPGAMGIAQHLCKGEYFALAPSAAKRIRGLVYPSPEGALTGLGVHTVVDLGGGVKLGPNAFYVEAIDYSVEPGHAEEFLASAGAYLPFLQQKDLTPDMSGIRPKLAGPGEPVRDFHIREESAAGLPGFVNLCGIESPGLTASPAIAKHVARIITEAE
jgi:L-2-hydroxyglutarate oxidase LhgO